MRTLALFLSLVLALGFLSACTEGGSDHTLNDGDIPSDGDTLDGDTADGDTQDGDTEDGDEPPVFEYSVPLAPDSPWPKFRRDARQTGATEWILSDDGSKLWRFQTGKGIFSSPVVAGDGTIYCGSADWNFYALNPDGTVKWQHETGEIIDSAALLDDKGRIYVGSGDGYIYAFDAKTGEKLWAFLADNPSLNKAFIRWFEGNIAIAPNGMLIAGNDNFFIYAIDRDTGEMIWRITMPDQTWSLPAIDVENERIYIGNNNIFDILGNVFAYDFSGNPLWQQGSLGTIAASPLLLDSGSFVLGGYDGYARAYDGATGTVNWEFAAKDHIYASAALQPDGSVLQAAADGTIYALDPDTGVLRWAFDWGMPIRSSPAVDGLGQIYLGTGDGHLVVLNPDGTLKWALRLILDDRDDINASPALGLHAIYVAGESGEIFGIPYDFCLRESEQSNPSCTLGPNEPLPAKTLELRYTTRFGTPLPEAPSAIAANDALAFSLLVRENNDTVLALIDSESLHVTLTPESDMDVQVSADRRFLTVVPATIFAGDLNGEVHIDLSGSYLVEPERKGLAMSGGTPAGSFSQSFVFEIKPAMAQQIPALEPIEGGPVSAWDLRRLAVPYPTLMPSYNQIGFDSLHFIISLIDRSGDAWLGWVTEGRPTGEGGATIIEPETRGVFPVQVRYEDGAMTLVNQSGFALEVMSAQLSFNTFRISTMLDAQGLALDGATAYAMTRCGGIPFYGQFLRILGLCNPETDMLIAYGAAIFEPYRDGTLLPPSGVGEVTFSSEDGHFHALLAGSLLKPTEHTVNLLVVSGEELKPLQLGYGLDTKIKADDAGNLTSVSIAYDVESAPESVTCYLVIDGYPVARGTLHLER